MTEHGDPHLDDQWFERTVRARRIAAGYCGVCGTRLIKPYGRPSRCPHCKVGVELERRLMNLRLRAGGEKDDGD